MHTLVVLTQAGFWASKSTERLKSATQKMRKNKLKNKLRGKNASLQKLLTQIGSHANLSELRKDFEQDLREAQMQVNP